MYWLIGSILRYVSYFPLKMLITSRRRTEYSNAARGTDGYEYYYIAISQVYVVGHVIS